MFSRVIFPPESDLKEAFQPVFTEFPTGLCFFSTLTGMPTPVKKHLPECHSCGQTLTPLALRWYLIDRMTNPVAGEFLPSTGVTLVKKTSIPVELIDRLATPVKMRKATGTLMGAVTKLVDPSFCGNPTFILCFI